MLYTAAHGDGQIEGLLNIPTENNNQVPTKHLKIKERKAPPTGGGKTAQAWKETPPQQSIGQNAWVRGKGQLESPNSLQKKKPPREFS